MSEAMNIKLDKMAEMIIAKPRLTPSQAARAVADKDETFEAQSKTLLNRWNKECGKAKTLDEHPRIKKVMAHSGKKSANHFRDTARK